MKVSVTTPLIVIDGVPIVDNDGYMSTIGSGSAQGQKGEQGMMGNAKDWPLVLSFLLASDSIYT
jgi:hypothetical protein